MHSLRRRLLSLPILLAWMGPSAAQEAPRVGIFTPQGHVERVRQVRVQFSEPIAAFGQAEAEAPFDVDCSASGAGRWVDSRNWVYEFDENLSAGERCRFEIKAGLETAQGEPVRGQRVFEFSTGGPSIVRSYPYEGSTISEDQAFVLLLNGGADAESVRRHAYFAVEGIHEQLGPKILTGEIRSQILKATHQSGREEDESVLVVQSRRPFPNDAQVQLVWAAGIEAPSGAKRRDDQKLAYRTRPMFTAHVSCSRVNAREDCIPIQDIELEFSDQVEWELASKIVLVGPDGESWEPAGPERGRQTSLASRVTFKAPFPPQASLLATLPDNFVDASGRELANASRFPMEARTADYPPLAKFAADFGIIEWKADPVLPVTIRSIEDPATGQMASMEMPGRSLRIGSSQVEQLLKWLRFLGRNEWQTRDESIFSGTETTRTLRIPKQESAKATEVVGIPLPEPGFHVVEIKSEILGLALLDPPQPMYVRTGALVTDMAVHLKHGRENSLVWVTSLQDAQPVPNAEVSVWNCRGRRLLSGRTDERGVAFLDALKEPVDRCSWRRYDNGLLAVAVKGDDMSFAHSSWQEGIEPWRYRLPVNRWWDPDPVQAHTVFGRPLLRAGETLHMKHVLRKRTMQGFDEVSPARLPKTLVIRHLGSDQEYSLPVSWAPDGTALSEWKIPKDAKLGRYQTRLIKGGAPKRYWAGGTFRVEEYRIPLATADIRPPEGPLVAPGELEYDLNVRYLAGGGAGGLPVKFRYQVSPRGVSFERFPDFAFSAGRVGENDLLARSEDHAWRNVRTVERTLDSQGGTRVKLEGLPKMLRPARLRAELEFRDPAGEVQTISSGTPLWHAQRQVGIKSEQWRSGAEDVGIVVGVADVEGRPLSDVEVRVDLYQRIVYSSRKRLVGGFYSYEHHSEDKLVVQDICSGFTDVLGRLPCSFESPVSGSIRLEARVKDPVAGTSYTNRSLWVVGEDDWWYEALDHDRIDLIPEQARYEPGETARLHARTPFQQATALITVEREGILEAYVRPISSKDPVFELEVCGSCAPNAFISALLVRGRVGDVQPTALIDLGRPTFRLGIAEIKVGWRKHEFKVAVRPEREVYHVRETAKVDIEVLSPGGDPPPKGAEVAVAAVDEGLLELMPNQSWDLLAAMMGQRPYEVETSTAQMQVVGKRHFGRKALPPGGGGGQRVTREMFDTLLFWEGRVQLDSQGRASVEIPLNDSLTSFRIAAVANDDLQRFGTGQATIRSTQDLMLLTGLAPVVREGDRILNEATVRNASQRVLSAEVTLEVEEMDRAFEPRQVELQPGEARELLWELDVPAGVEKLHYLFSAKAADAEDSTRVEQEVVPAVPVRPYQATLTRVDDKWTVPLAFPDEAVPGRGGVRLGLSRSLLDSLEAVRGYFRRYPYICFEQKLSKSVGLQNRALFDRLMDALPSYLDRDGLVKYFPGDHLLGSDVLSAYLLAAAHESGWAIPEPPLNRIARGLRGFVEGRVERRSDLPTAEVALRKLSAIEALSRYGQADPPLLSTIDIQPNLWATSGVLDWINILLNMPDIPSKERHLEQAQQVLRARIDFQGTALGFSTERRDYLWWLMVSPDSNANRTVSTALRLEGWSDDIPRLVNGTLQRRKRGRWWTTIANVWGVLAMKRFAEMYESAPVAGITSANILDESTDVNWQAHPEPKAEFYAPWPATPGESKGEAVVAHTGGRSPWASLQAEAAIPRRDPFFAGYRIKKTYTPVRQKKEGVWSRGDVIRVRLEIDAQSDRTWVVVDDPVPPGAVVLGSGLGRDSAMLQQGEENQGWYWKAHEERTFESFRTYYRYLRSGQMSLEYTLRLNQSGTFSLPPTRVEAMYSPEMFGELPNDDVEVTP